ncbi:RloB-like protein [Sinosporangium album]|uniref:RloB-like protein n=1 Tax=Sinosporangium album TaxID=504805 RepID=A0A1G7TGW2_9ACTN|nr:RloB family protein [Sinosporangium album]SDG34264.1 RloB-like protein [Sinosporangium album]
MPIRTVQIWCVLDTELDHGLAERMLAEADGKVMLALSTPCFDFWLLLHREDHRAPFQTAGGAERASKRVMPTWSKGGTKFADFQDGVGDACRRARAADPEGKNYMRNPSTSVWRLMQSIREPVKD